jgi:hypothetical protein
MLQTHASQLDYKKWKSDVTSVLSKFFAQEGRIQLSGAQAKTFGKHDFGSTDFASWLSAIAENSVSMRKHFEYIR